ncbi:MAG: polysaccharide deacetylase family protein [Candidatus Dojkabacteria bacterium]|nr:MAG: polysaccharide deacetylase family protein [Candidatus Dojkabacteria bacterium]
MKLFNKQLPVLVAFGIAFAVVGAAGMWLYQDTISRFFRGNNEVTQQQEQKPQNIINTLPSKRIAVIEYHVVRNISSDQKSVYDDVTVPTDAFFYQMEYLANNGFTTLTFQDLAYHLEKNIPLPKKPVIVTFNDGHVTVLNNAQSTLKKFNQKAVVFMVTNYIGQSGYLSETAITDLIRAGNIEIASHTVSKVKLADVPREDMEKELRLSKLALETKFPIKVTTFAYPFDNYSDGVARFAQMTGYSFGVLTDEKLAVFPPELPMKVSRMRVTKEMSLNDFGAMLETLK